MREGVSRQPEYGNPPWVGVGVIILPYKQSREKYIKQCYRSRQVNILLETGMIAVKCNVSEEAIQNIRFPQDYKTLGSHVIFVTERHNQTPYIIAVLDKINERVNLEENSFNFSRDIGKSRVNLIGKANGELLLNVDGDTSIININASGKNSQININSEGEVVVSSKSSIKANSSKNIESKIINSRGEQEAKLTLSSSGMKYEDKNDNIFEIDKNSNKIKNFNGSQPIPLGNTLKSQLEQNNLYLTQLQAAISSALVILDSLGVPVSTTFNTAMTGATKGNYSSINSQKTFTD